MLFHLHTQEEEQIEAQNKEPRQLCALVEHQQDAVAITHIFACCERESRPCRDSSQASKAHHILSRAIQHKQDMAGYIIR